MMRLTAIILDVAVFFDFRRKIKINTSSRQQWNKMVFDDYIMMFSCVMDSLTALKRREMWPKSQRPKELKNHNNKIISRNNDGNINKKRRYTP